VIPAARDLRAWPLAAWPLAALVALAPLGGGATASTSLLVLHTAVAAALVAVAFAPRDGRALPAALPLAAAFLAWCLVGVLRAGYLFGSLTAVWDVLMALCVLWVAWRVAVVVPFARALCGLVILWATVQSCVALLQHAFDPATRAPGSFLNPNHLAAYLNLGLGLALGRLHARRGRDPWAASACALIVAAQLLAVASRGALLALVVVLVGAAWMAARGRRARVALRVGAVALLVLASVAVAARFRGPEDVYRYARIEMWRASAVAAREHPVAGLGPGMFEHVAARYNFPRQEGPVRYGRTFRSTHSQYLDVLVETGAIGLVLFLAVTGAALAGLAVRVRRRSGRGGGLRRGALLGLVLLAIQGIVEPVLRSPAVALTAAAIVGLGLSTRCVGAGMRPRRRTSWRLLVPAAGVAAGVYYAAVLAPWLGDLHFRHLLAAGGDAARFRVELTAALRHNPFQPHYYATAARAILDSQARLDHASYTICYNYAAKAAMLHPADPRFLLLEAEVVRRGSTEVFGDRAGLERADELYRSAVERAPTDPRPAATLAGFLLALDRPAEALHGADAALAIEPHFQGAHRIRVEALRRMGRDGAAARERMRMETEARELLSYRPQNGYEALILGREGYRAHRN